VILSMMLETTAKNNTKDLSLIVQQFAILTRIVLGSGTQSTVNVILNPHMRVKIHLRANSIKVKEMPQKTCAACFLKNIQLKVIKEQPKLTQIGMSYSAISRKPPT
jgi:hypothetical protein